MMFRANYNYDSKYLLTLTARRDGYSGFGNDSKWGVFPSLAVGWNIAKENFFEGIDRINNLKLRVSYGKNGNQAVDAYETMARVASESEYDGKPDVVNSYVNGSSTLPGFYPSTLGLRTLGWESTTSLNFGLDFTGSQVFSLGKLVSLFPWRE